MSNNGVPQIRVSQQDSGDNMSVSLSSKKDNREQIEEESKSAAGGGASGEQKKHKLSPEVESQLKEAFAVFDVSGDGQIDASELRTILEAVNKKPIALEEVEEMIAAVDEGGDGEIQLPEFLQLMADQMHQQEQDEELIAAFKLFGAENVKDVIKFDQLQAALDELDGGEFKEDELQIIFDEIAGASKKPNMRQRGPGSLARDNSNADNLNNDDGARGISFTDFMLMMMAK